MRESNEISVKNPSEDGMDEPVVKNRAVYFIGGYDPKSPEAFFDRLDRETERFEDVWNVGTQTEAIEQVSPTITRQTRESSDPDGRWTVTTDFHFVCLDSVVTADFNRPFSERILRYLRTFADYNLSGTGFAFLRHAWRFWFYFMYPFSMLAIGVAVSLVLSMLIATSGVALAWLTAPIIFVAAMASFMKLIAKPYFVFHLMDLWSFSSDFIHRRRPDMDAILDELSSLVADNADGYDEIIMVGHSTGGALILDGAARALTSTPSIAAQKDRFWILTIGSTSLKIGLHPKAQWYRDKLNKALNGSNARWVEFQCHSDIINFARTNPAKLMGLTQTASPHFQAFNVRIKKMLHSKTYKRIKRNFFRVHYQFVFGNTRRYFYDFPAICFGPGGLGLRVENRRAFGRMLHRAFPDIGSGEPPQENTQ